MAPTISLVVILSCSLFATLVRADVAHLGYKRNNGRLQTTRLQRLESGPKPYPASGYRPNRQFSLPREQPLFPLGNQQTQNNNGFNNLGETQRPDLTYGTPNRQQSQVPQAQPTQNNNNGFNNLAEPQQPELLYAAPTQDQTRFPVTNQQEQSNEANQPEANQPQFNNNNNGFNNLAEPQQPELLYGAPAGAPARLTQFQVQRLRQILSARLQQEQQPQQLYAAPLAESQRPQVTYNAPARLRQSPRPARLQTQPQQPQQFYAAPQQLLEPQAERFTVLQQQKPARLTDNREDNDNEDEDKTAEASTVDIETDAKKEDATKKKVETPQTITYFPAGAFSFVQPASAAYVTAGLPAVQPASAAYVTAGLPAIQQVSAAYTTAGLPAIQPASAAYTIGSPFLQQSYATFAAPAQLRAW